MSLKKYLPTKEQLRSQKSLRFLGEVIFEPNLWHMNRHSISWAAAVGCFCMFLPVPFQMIPGILICIWIRCNVPLTVALIWISNPVTIAPMFYGAYLLGTFMLGEPALVTEEEVGLDWIETQFSSVWQPLVLGCLVTGLTLGCLAFTAVRLYWRWRIARYWYSRKQRKYQRQKQRQRETVKPSDSTTRL